MGHRVMLNCIWPPTSCTLTLMEYQFPAVMEKGELNVTEPVAVLSFWMNKLAGLGSSDMPTV